MADRRHRVIGSSGHRVIGSEGQGRGHSGQKPEARDQKPEAGGQRPGDSRSLDTENLKLETGAAKSHLTFLPELVAKSKPALRCSSGQVARIEYDDGVTIHMACFVWHGAETGSVLEAYKHPPEACLGYIGLRLLERLSDRTYRVGTESLRVEHTLFAEPAGARVHAFKAVWVAGARQLVDATHPHPGDSTRLLRWHAAATRFRPSYAVVVRGAVRGAVTPDTAWSAFQKAMLANLTMTTVD